MRIRAMSDQVLWEIAGLFERIGTVQDGINTIARPPAVTDRPGAAELTVPRGELRFKGIRFHYGRDVARLGGGVIAEIGRASCRERVCQYGYITVVAVSLKKK